MKTQRETETTDDRVRAAGWFPGRVRDWDTLTSREREDIAFLATGCAVAYPTWPAPVECVHTGCRVRRGEIPPIAITNAVLRYEADSGWLRFMRESRDGRARLARLMRAVRNAALATGEYDPWKVPGGWQAIVAAAISG